MQPGCAEFRAVDESGRCSKNGPHSAHRRKIARRERAIGAETPRRPHTLRRKQCRQRREERGSAWLA